MTHIQAAIAELESEAKRLGHLSEKHIFQFRPARAMTFSAQRQTINNCLALLRSLTPPRNTDQSSEAV